MMDEAIAESSIPDESEGVASASYEHYFFVFSIGNFPNYLLTKFEYSVRHMHVIVLVVK